MSSNVFYGYIWPVTQEEGGLPLFYNSSGHHVFRYRRPRSPKEGDVLFFYSERMIIGFVPVIESAYRINDPQFKRAVGVDFSRKQIFDPPILIDELADVCSVLSGKVGRKLHDSFQTAPILSCKESKILLKMGAPIFKKTRLVKELTPTEYVDWNNDLADSLRGRKAPPRRIKQVLFIFKRNQKLIKALKKEYDGICQICGIENLIETDSGEFYTEGHHVIPLGEEGYDNLDNVVILCPLCHTKLHYSKDRALLKEQLLYSESHKRILEQFEREHAN